MDDKTWNKKLFGLEADVSDIQDENKLEKLRQDLWDKEGDWIEEESTTVAKPTDVPEPPVSIDDIPDIDIAEIQDAGWLTYQKNPCRPGEVGWVKNPVEFTSWQDPPQVLLRLVKAIHKTADKKLVLGDMEYYLNKKFINRRPVK